MFVGKDRREFDSVLELSNVTGPFVAHESPDGVSRDVAEIEHLGQVEALRIA
jgi:hypothetical protein